MTDYLEKRGFNKWLFRGEKPVVEETEDEIQFKTPQIPSTVIKGDFDPQQIRRAVDDISNLSGVTTASALGVLNGGTALLTSTITDVVNPDKIMYAFPEITAYDGSIGVANSIIYPTASWKIDQGFSYHYNATRTDSGKSLTYAYAITNSSGVTKNIYWIIRWRFVGTNTAAA